MRSGVSQASEFDVEAGLGAPAHARAALDRLLRGSPTDLRFTARLILSELVTTSVVHAGLKEGDPIHVTVEPRDERLHVSVIEPRGRPGARPRGQRHPLAGRGPGLAIVESLADAWGVERDQSEMCFWFELSGERFE
jgi:anti-sigma regulatory factor (Ser/Thr protein kinase)